jgi:hypothetical protein
LYGNQYAPSPRSNPQPAHQYYNAAQTPIRPPSNNMQRPPATAPVAYQNPRPVSSAPYRPTSYGTPTYPPQPPRPVQQQYAPQSQQQYLHTPPAQNYMRPAGQNYQQMAQSAAPVQMNGRYPSQPAYAHQAPAPQQNGMNYQYGNGTNLPRQASPQKPMYSPQTGTTPARPPYSTPTPANTALSRPPYHQNPATQPPAMNGSSSHAPQPQFAHQSTTNYSTFMTQAEQASLIDRQRAQMASQQATAQQQARQVIMGSPSRSQAVNGTNPVAAGT